ncbi:tetratricopeptide repeat protein [Planctomycetaceae bacterium SH139]
MSELESDSFAIVRLATQLGFIPAAVASELREKSSADCAEWLGQQDYLDMPTLSLLRELAARQHESFLQTEPTQGNPKQEIPIPAEDLRGGHSDVDLALHDLALQDTHQSRLADTAGEGTLTLDVAGQSASASADVSWDVSVSNKQIAELASDDRFEIVRSHAEGGLGQVFLANDRQLHREVALKEIKSHLVADESSRSRFTLEAKITGRLEHPGIVPVYALGSYPDGRPYYAMRFIRGDSLKQVCRAYHDRRKNGKAEGIIELRKLLGHFIDVCQALEYAHSRGVVHRDIKPDNIMIGQFGETLLVDWGLAKSLSRSGGLDAGEEGVEDTTLPLNDLNESNQTQHGSVLGTPSYMSPEQARGAINELGPTSDVYSLGATLCFLLTGQPPVSRQSVLAMLEQVKTGKVLAPRDLQPDVPKALDAICRKAMSLEIENRYESAAALAGDIERWLADEPVVAYREGSISKSARWLRRHRGTAATALVAGVLLIVSSLFAVWVVNGYRRDAERQRSLAVAAAEAATELAETNEQLAATEKVARDEADQRTAEAEAVSEFLLDMFRRPNPSMNGANVTVNQLLDETLKSLPDSFPDNLLTRAKLATVLGTTYRSLGKYQESVLANEQALQWTTEALGEEDSQTLLARNELAMALFRRGDRDNSIDEFRTILALRRKVLGLDHQYTIGSINNLAYVLQESGQLVEAISLFEEAVERRVRTLGYENTDTLQSMGNLAHAYLLGDDVKRATAMNEEVLQRKRDYLGTRHTGTFTAMQNLALCYIREKKNDEAEALLNEVIPLMIEFYGGDHPSTLNTLSVLTALLVRTDRADEAIAYHAEIYAGRLKRIGYGHPQILSDAESWITGHQAAGLEDESVRLAEQLTAEFAEHLPAEHPNRLGLQIAYGKALDVAGRLEEAERVLEDAQQNAFAAIGERALMSQRVTNYLITCQMSIQKFSQAEANLHRLHRILHEESASLPPETLKLRQTSVRNRMRKLYEEWGQPELLEIWNTSFPDYPAPLAKPATNDEHN